MAGMVKNLTEPLFTPGICFFKSPMRIKSIGGSEAKLTEFKHKIKLWQTRKEKNI
jgi:hypothetical protein